MKICEVCRARFRGNPVACPLDGGKLVDLPDPLLGRTIAGRYVITAKIGAGGMGTVYRATYDVVGRDVAIKFLSPDLAVDPTSRKRFLREAKAANRINHEHIIDITDFGQTDDDLVYLVMEFLEGVPLNREIARGPMDHPRSLKIALQMAQALARAHELDVIHRDIKPDNVYLLSGYDGDFVKILDFGLAQMKGELRLTATGTVFGTPEYMAPEQARGAPATFAVDLYALGCVLFEMITNRLPFEGTTPDLILKHMREPAKPPSSRRRDVPPRVDALVMRLLEKKPEARHQSAYELAEEIKQIIEELGGSDRSARPTPARKESRAALAQTHVSHTIVAEDAWEERIDLFRSLVPRAHPDGEAPGWLMPAIDELSQRVAAVRQMRKEMGEIAGTASRQQDGAREARLRIGRALDELARDEARVLKEIADIQPRVEEGQHRLSEIERPLLRAWAAIPALPLSGPELTRDVVEALRDAGNLSSIWIEAERTMGAHARDLTERERERDDLRFQIAQLKGRMGTTNAESDIDMSEIRDRTSELDGALGTAVDEVVKTAEPVYRHFMSFPQLRPAVLGRSDAGVRGT